MSAGVLSSQEVRSSAQGAPYSVWRLSDLRGGEALVMLFGKAHADHYREVGAARRGWGAAWSRLAAACCMQ